MLSSVVLQRPDVFLKGKGNLRVSPYLHRHRKMKSSVCERCLCKSSRVALRISNENLCETCEQQRLRNNGTRPRPSSGGSLGRNLSSELKLMPRHFNQGKHYKEVDPREPFCNHWRKRKHLSIGKARHQNKEMIKSRAWIKIKMVVTAPFQAQRIKMRLQPY